MLNNADGYYGGLPQLLTSTIRGQAGFVFLPLDTDATFDWLALFDWPAVNDHPVFWWEAARQAGAVARPALVDRDERRRAGGGSTPTRWRRCWPSGTSASSTAGSTPGRSRSPPTSRPIRTRWATVDDVPRGRAEGARGGRRAPRVPAHLRRLRAERRGRRQDGDGARWCDDCRDDDASIHVGAAEMCNGVDDNCNGVVDEGC